MGLPPPIVVRLISRNRSNQALQGRHCSVKNDTRFRLRTFGGLTLTCATGPLAGAGTRRKPLALLAVLAFHPRGISREKLTAILWPEATEEGARSALRQTIYGLRRDLGEQDIVTGTSEVQLDTALCSSDVGDFITALERDDQAGAVELYTGPFLDGFHLRGEIEFEEWQATKRAWLESQVKGSLETLARQHGDAGRHQEAVRFWRRLAELDPLSSRFASGLVSALAASGDVASALRVGAEHASTLRTELDTSPSAELVTLLAELRRRAPPLPPSSVTSGASDRSVGAAEVTPAHDSPAGAPPPEGATARQTLSRVVWLGTALAAAMAVYAVDPGGKPGPAAETPRPPVLAIAPFTVSADSALGYLGEGIVNLLAARLSGVGPMTILPPGAALAALRSAGESGTSTERLAVAARALGADRVLTGSIVGSRARLEISAVVLTLDGSELATAHTSGAADSASALADRVAGTLLLLTSGEREDRLPSIVGSPLAAVKAYILGQQAYRRGDYASAADRFREAVQFDSLFALAWLRLALASGWADRPAAEHDLGMARAWGARERLIPRDRIFLEAFGTGRIPELRTTVDGAMRRWERALAAVPDWPEVWFEYGDMLFHDGLGVSDGTRLAAAGAMRRALALDSTLAPGIPHLLQLEANAGDTAAVRRLANRYLSRDSVSGAATYVRWRLAHATGDRRLQEKLRSSMATHARAGLRWIIQGALFDAVAVADALPAAAALVTTSASAEERYDAWRLSHAVALNAGSLQRARAALDAIAAVSTSPHEADRLRILDMLYSIGDSAAAAASAKLLAGNVSRAMPELRADRVARYKDLCVLGQWQLMQRDIAAATRTMATLRAAKDLGTLLPEAERGEGQLCGAMLHVMLGTAPRAADLPARIATLDSLAQRSSQGDAVPYYHLVRAKALAANGDSTGALRAIRQRWYFAFYAPYMTTFHREEGRYALAVGDSAGAARAMASYLALRLTPDAAVQPEVAQVRSQLQRLSVRGTAPRATGAS